MPVVGGEWARRRRERWVWLGARSDGAGDASLRSGGRGGWGFVGGRVVGRGRMRMRRGRWGGWSVGRGWGGILWGADGWLVAGGGRGREGMAYVHDWICRKRIGCGG